MGKICLISEERMLGVIYSPPPMERGPMPKKTSEIKKINGEVHHIDRLELDLSIRAAKACINWRGLSTASLDVHDIVLAFKT